MTANYEHALRASEQVAWKLDEVLPDNAGFDFSRDFLPETLVRAEMLPFVDPDERRILNHIRAHGYLCTFGLVEEFILPFVLDRLATQVGSDMTEVRALLAFANEEAKHIALFRRFRAVFERGFGHRCEVIGPPEAVRDHVLKHGELGVGLLTLHIEWMTQQHYLEMVRGTPTLEPGFERLLHQHWLEECQHARIDGWIVEAVAERASPEARARAFEEYVALLDFLDQGLAQQVQLDLAAFERATGRVLDDAEHASFVQVQHGAQRHTFLGCGVTHPRLRASIERVYPEGLSKLQELAQAYA